MKTTYESKLGAHVTVDEDSNAVHIRHSQEPWASDEDVARSSAESYLKEWAQTLRVSDDQIKNLQKRVAHFDPRDQGVEYQLQEEKQLFDTTVVGYAQTYMNTPVWRKGLSIKIKQNPNRIVGATNNSERDLHGSLPADAQIAKYKGLFRETTARNAAADAGLGRDEAEGADEAEVRRLLNLAPAGDAAAGAGDRMHVLSGKFFVYKYDPQKRFAGKPAAPAPTEANEEQHEIPIPPIPPVAGSIVAGQSYLVSEVIFTSDAPGFNGLTWLTLVELDTGSILYVECMTCGLNGLVFRRDPVVKTGNLTITSAANDATLNPLRDDVPLTHLDAPVAGVQNLRGTYVDIEEIESPTVAAPTQPSGTDFDYDARTNNFGAVNAYYHQTELFKTIESLGFPIATYFDGTTFPIPVDHRGLGNVINAHWSPNGSGGTGHMCYALCDTTNTAQPLCRAVDPWVHWHEMGGHGVLGDHVGSGLLGFSHSHGDGLAAIQNDPESALRTVPERFRYAPFRPFTSERRFDRPVATWAWGAGPPNDDGGYGSEQILATCHFRIYRSIGGDSSDLGRRRFASRVATYLILRTTANLTPGTNPASPQVWCEEMQDADLENWTSEGLFGGAYNKVIRWAFEKQGCYQPPGAPAPVTTPGAPPAVDVYLEDGRNGEYQYQSVHWNCQAIWNRNAADGLAGHQNAIDGQPNFVYGKVKNRGTVAANNVNVRAFHSLPGAGLTWPTDFVEMSPIGGLTIPSIAPGSAAEPTVGPFQWEPNINVYGHDCVLMIASVNGDPSNIDNFTAGETVQEWRLVPNDNNIGQRNVSVVPGGGGGQALIAALHGAIFVAGNNLTRRAKMQLRVQLPKVLTRKRWTLRFKDLAGTAFVLKPGEKRKLQLDLRKGEDFKPADFDSTRDRMITVTLLANGIPLGGNSYLIDPKLKKPSGGGKRPTRPPRPGAEASRKRRKVAGRKSATRRRA
jgi:hypothetical protein